MGMKTEDDDDDDDVGVGHVGKGSVLAKNICECNPSLRPLSFFCLFTA